jgi:hypothetical protein
MVKIMAVGEDFLAMVDDIAMMVDGFDPKLSEEDWELEMARELKTHPKYQKVFECWEASNRMRLWLTEKKKNWSNKISEDERNAPGKPKDEVEIEKIIERITEKAEMIVKLSMPKSWDDDLVHLSDVDPEEPDMGVPEAHPEPESVNY